MIWARFLALRALRSLGYDVRRVANPAKLPIESLETDPVTVEYCLSKRGHAVFEIPTRDCRGFHSLGLQLRPEDHPFVRAFVNAMNDNSGSSNGQRAEIEATLASYYAAVRPASASAAVGLPGDGAPGLKDISAIGYVLPWWEKSACEMTQGRKRSLKYVAMRYGVSAGGEDGHTFFGPVKPAKLEVQVLRLDQLLQSVHSRGFQPFARDFPTKVVALRKDGAYRWLIEEGQHRFAIGAAMHVEAIPAMVTSVVRREDAHLWPQVISGVFTEAGALSLFDRLFDGVPAPACREWINAGK